MLRLLGGDSELVRVFVSTFHQGIFIFLSTIEDWVEESKVSTQGSKRMGKIDHGCIVAVPIETCSTILAITPSYGVILA